MTSGRDRGRAIYATIWRWHFYAGLFVIPFILLLAVTGTAYLFKPQVERWEERAFQGLPVAGAAAPQRQVDAALAAFPGASFNSYRLPERAGDAAMVHLVMSDGRTMRDVFVSPRGEVLGSIAPDARLMEWTKRIHGQLLLGKQGSWLVELAASWAIVLVLSGLYLWWPRDRAIAGVVWPRLNGGRRIFWRDLHAVTGFWISGLVLALLVTGLPWAGLWGSAFSSVRAEMGWVKGEQDWTVGGELPAAGRDAHARHDHSAMVGKMPYFSRQSAVGIDRIIANAAGENLAFPVTISPPAMAGEHGGSFSTAWVVRSDSQNRPLRMTITYDAISGQEIAREGFVGGHLVDRVIGYGIAWHEGPLFGWVNQLIGVLTANGLILMAVSGLILWRRRKPSHKLGAGVPAHMGGAVAILIVLAAALPLLAASLVVVWLFEKLALPHLSRIARRLDVPPCKAPVE